MLVSLYYVLITVALYCWQSSLLLALLGELSPRAGRVQLAGRVAYTSQEPWVFSGTIRDNIICGQSFNPQRFLAAIKAAALNKVRVAFGK